MIGKELLSEILGIEVENVKHFGTQYLHINSTTRKDCGISISTPINIYELAAKSKEWALEHNYLLHSGPAPISGFNADVMRRFTDDKWLEFKAETEPEAIFKAVEWIWSELIKEKL